MGTMKFPFSALELFLNRKPLREFPPSREYVRTNFDMRIGEKLFYLLQKEIPTIRMVITVMVTMFTCFRDP